MGDPHTPELPPYSPTNTQKNKALRVALTGPYPSQGSNEELEC